MRTQMARTSTWTSPKPLPPGPPFGQIHRGEEGDREHQAETVNRDIQPRDAEEDLLHRSDSPRTGRGSGWEDRVVDQPGRPDPDGKQGHRPTALTEDGEGRERVGVGDLGIVDRGPPFGF